MENFINKFIEQNVKGVDTYQHNGSTWLIFTNNKQWVIELTEDKTLWYNYNFFKSIFKFFSMDVIENQHYITKWVEDTIQNGVRHTTDAWRKQQLLVEDTIQNGVRHTLDTVFMYEAVVEDTIQNGVRHTTQRKLQLPRTVEDTIQNGVRHTKGSCIEHFQFVEDTIQNGGRRTIVGGAVVTGAVEDTIQNGVKETKISPTHTEYGDWLDGDERLDEIIKNGVIAKTP